MTRIKTSQRIARMYANKNEKLYSLNSYHSRNSLINLLICYINMRNFYLEYQICQTLSGKLTWSHYCELLGLSTLGIKSQRITRMNTNKNKKLYSRYSYNSYHSCNSLINSLANSYYSCHSHNSLIYSLTYSLAKTGEEIEYFV
jgi:hypothetical protein